MSKELEFLISEARKHQITPAERDAQVRSFAFGNTHLENEAITREDVDRAVNTLLAEEQSGVGV